MLKGIFGRGSKSDLTPKEPEAPKASKSEGSQEETVTGAEVEEEDSSMNLFEGLSISEINQDEGDDPVDEVTEDEGISDLGDVLFVEQTSPFSFVKTSATKIDNEEEEKEEKGDLTREAATAGEEIPTVEKEVSVSDENYAQPPPVYSVPKVRNKRKIARRPRGSGSLTEDHSEHGSESETGSEAAKEGEKEEPVHPSVENETQREELPREETPLAKEIETDEEPHHLNVEKEYDSIESELLSSFEEEFSTQIHIFELFFELHKSRMRLSSILEAAVSGTEEGIEEVDGLEVRISRIGQELAEMDHQPPGVEQRDMRSSQMNRMSQLASSMESEIREKISEEQRKMETKLEEHKEAATQKSIELTDRASGVERELSHTKLDLQLVNERWQAMEEKVSEHTKEEQTKLSGLNKKLEEVEEEIEELEKKLLALREGKHDIEGEIVNVNEEISKKTKPFRTEIDRIGAEKGRFEAEIEQLEGELSVASSAIEQHKIEVDKWNAEIEQADVYLAGLRRKAGQIADNVLPNKCMGISSHFWEGYGEHINDLIRIESELRSQEAELAEVEGRISSDKLSLISFKSRRSTLVDESKQLANQIVTLEGEKVNAISQRKFRYAGDVAKEIKKVVERKDECVHELKDLEDKESELEKHLDRMKEAVFKEENAVKELSESHLAILSEFLTEIKTFIESVSPLEKDLKGIDLSRLEDIKGSGDDSELTEKIVPNEGIEDESKRKEENTNAEDDERPPSEMGEEREAPPEEFQDDKGENITKLEAELERYIEIEDFEKCEEIDAKIKELRGEV